MNNGLYYLNNKRKHFKATVEQCIMSLEQLSKFRQIVYSVGLAHGSKRIHLGGNPVMSTSSQDAFKKNVDVRTWYPNRVSGIRYPIRRCISFKIQELNDFYLVLKELQSGYWSALSQISKSPCSGEHESSIACEICRPNDQNIIYCD